MRNWYKFAGVFRLNRVQTENDQFYGDSWCWYDRVDTVAECPKADWRVSSIDEDAMDTMRGEFVKCELLDEVECVDKEGKHIEGKDMAGDDTSSCGKCAWCTPVLRGTG